jgi:glycogen synthase
MTGMTALCADAVDDAAVMSTLQFGLEWFPDGIGGGSSRFFATIADYLMSEHVTVHGIVTGREPTTKRRRDGIRVFCAYNASLTKRLRGARTAVREILAVDRVDIVASHFALFTFACLDLVKDLPLVVHFHGPWAAEARAEGRSLFTSTSHFFVEKAVYARADKAIVLSRAFGDVLHRSYGVPTDKIVVIPGGVDIERFRSSYSRADARMRLGLPLNRPVVVVVRRLAKRMGLENLIASFAEIHKAGKDAVLVVVGGGQLLHALRRQVYEYGLSRHVIFAGRVNEDDLPLYYRAADFSIVPSVALEGFGLVVAESLACGTPAIVTPIGGLPEVVAGLSEQLILEGSSTKALADGLRSALEEKRRLPSPDACTAYARAHFNWPIIANRVKSVYGDVLCGPRS